MALGGPVRSRAWVLVTALPPTTGHEDLVGFAVQAASEVHLVLCTQPSEPLAEERHCALLAMAARAHLQGAVRVHRIHEELPQEPADAPGFWAMWRTLLMGLGAREGDLVVASEPYGMELAATIGGEFLPYDPGRLVNPAKASRIRQAPIEHFSDLLTEFQPFLRKRLTLFGAESVGKTTMTRRLEESGLAVALPEWARPYQELSEVGPEVTAAKMRTIWQGQLAQQQAAEAIAARRRRPFIAQDTDLFSTVGYWLLKGAEFGEPTVPAALWANAADNASDLYVILGQAAVPFASDPLRYGGDRRESADEFWISLCEHAGLPWVLVNEPDIESREDRIMTELRSLFGNPLAYSRRGAQYESAGGAA
jgi:HTH-type transcriptional regulator, transcriptional repressor of NAD biosynthesis genes